MFQFPNRKTFEVGDRVKVRGFEFLYIPFGRSAIDDKFDADYLGTVIKADKDLPGFPDRYQIKFDIDCAPMWFEYGSINHV